MLTLQTFLALAVFYLCTQILTKQFSKFVSRLGGGQKAIIVFWSLIFLPGTILHEISHFLVAASLGARTGKIEIFPESLDLDSSGHQRSVRLGSVQTSRLNPIQGFFVGLAPLLIGLIVIVFLSSQLQVSFKADDVNRFAIEGYLFFVIANSMFPSLTDIKQTLPFVVISLVLFGLAWLLGFQLLINPASNFWAIITTLRNTLLISIFFNFVIIALLLLSNRIVKLFHKAI